MSTGPLVATTISGSSKDISPYTMALLIRSRPDVGVAMHPWRTDAETTEAMNASFDQRGEGTMIGHLFETE